MSDTFNASANKQKIISLLGLGQQDNHYVEVDAFPPQFRSESTDYSSADIAQKLMDNGLTVLKPRDIRDMIPMELDFISPNWAPAVKGKKFALPLGETTFLPKYNATYFKLPYDTAGLRQLLYQQITPKHPDEDNAGFTKKVFDAAGQKVFTNGTLDGQLNRLKQMYAIARRDGMPESASRDLLTIAYDYFKPNDPTEDRYDPYYHVNPYEMIARVLDDYMPLATTKSYIDGGFPGLYNAPSWFVSLIPGHEYDYLPQIGLDKSASTPYLRKTKGEVTPNAIAIADMILNGTNRALAKGVSPTTGGINLSTTSGSPAQEALQRLYNDFWYLGCGFAFPKAERYNRDEYLTKTRNIYSMPYPAHLIASCLLAPAMAGCLNTLQTQTKSLYAFNPFYGGMHNLIGDMLGKMEDGELTISYVYADNWYLIVKNTDTNKYTFFSIDFEKAEAQHQRMDVRAMIYYLLTRGHSDADGKPMFNLTWSHVLMNLLPNLCVDNSVIIGNQQVLWPGLASGVTLTFVINHLRSSLWDVIYTKQAKRDPGCRWPSNNLESGFQRLARMYGFRMKIEREIDDFEKVLRDLESHPTAGPDHGHPYKVVDIDLLGWSVTFDPRLGRYIPILETDRLADSVACPKNDPEAKKYAAKPWKAIEYHIARWTAVHMVGGWNYPALARTAENMIHSARQRLMKVSDFHALGEITLDSTEFADFLQLGFSSMKYNYNLEEHTRLHADKEIPQSVTEQLSRINNWRAMRDKREREPSVVDQLSVLATIRADLYLSARDMPTLKESLNLNASTKKTPVYMDAIREFESIRAVFSSFPQLTTAPAKWKYTSMTPKELSDPFATLQLKFNWGEGMPAGVLRAATKHGVKPITQRLDRQMISPVATATVSNPAGATSLIPGVTNLRDVATKDLPVPKSNHSPPPAIPHRYRVDDAEATLVELTRIKGLLGDATMKHRLWLDFAQSKFVFKPELSKPIIDLLATMQHEEPK